MRSIKARTLAVAAALFSLSVQASAAPPSDGKVWISLGDTAYSLLQKHTQATPLSSVQAASRFRASPTERIHLVQVDEAVLAQLSESLHHELKRCGGYKYHPTKADGLAALARHDGSSRLLAPAAVAKATRPSYVIDQQSTVNPLLGQMQASNVGQTIVDLSTGFNNRFYKTTGGVNASNWLKSRWTALANGRTDITVEQFTHPTWAQKSVIATIKGTDNSAEVVVLGGHLDSTIGNSTGETSVAPGADDDASGIASLTEAFRVMASNNYKPRRTIKFMAYAAEEVGLRGSAEIAKSFASAGTNVVGVMQLDMTNYKGSVNDIYIYTDYTDATQNTFLTNLISSYLPTLKVGTDRCGYGCSDHASWTGQGYAASLPFEASFNQDNPRIHTSGDTYANTGNQADHALKFAKLALAYAVELGSDGPGVPPPADKTETFTGSLTLRQTRSFGPFKVAAGGTIKASTTGTGDIDLYQKLNSAPTTSSYGCKSDSSSATEACTLNVTVNSDGYVLLNGYSAGSYTLKVTYRPQ